MLILLEFLDKFLEFFPDCLTFLRKSFFVPILEGKCYFFSLSPTWVRNTQKLSFTALKMLS